MLLALDVDPDTKLHDLAEDLGASYRWMVKITSDLLAGGYLERERRGRSYTYITSSPTEVDVLDPRSVMVYQLSQILAQDTNGEDAARCELDVDPPEVQLHALQELRQELARLRHDVLIETQRLQRVRAECRHLESAVERARSILRLPGVPHVIGS